MIRILIGIILFVIGIISVTASVIWLGAIIAGPVLAVQGFKTMKNAQKQKDFKVYFSSNFQELIERLFAKETIDDIADHLFANKGIPVYITYNFYGEYLMYELSSNNDILKENIHQLLKIQRQDFTVNVIGDMKYFSADSTTIKYDESAQLYIEDNIMTGILLLNKSHVLFFPEHKSFWKNLLKKGWDKIYDTPLFFVPLIFDLLFAVKKEIQKPLGKSKLKVLKNIFDKGRCIHMVIGEIETIETVKKKLWFSAHSCILLSANSGYQMCLGTSETKAKQWVNDVSKQIKIIALAEGKNLF